MEPYRFRNTPSRKRSRLNAELRESARPAYERLTRSASLLGNIFKASSESGATRNNLEEEDVPVQCESVLGPVVPGKTLCWLCGFPIQGLASLLPANYKYSEYLDSSVCEHVLPVRLAKIVTGLYVREFTGPIDNANILHSVYEYAHPFCNMAKSHKYFISKPNTATQNWCDLVVNEAKIENFLKNLYIHVRSPKHPRRPFYETPDGKGRVDRNESGIFQVVESNRPQKKFKNNVECYVKNYLNGNKDLWIRQQFLRIREKCQSMVDRLKERDGCGTGAPGVLFSQSMQALNEISRYGRVLPRLGPIRPTLARTSSFSERYGSIPLLGIRSLASPSSPPSLEVSPAPFIDPIGPGGLPSILEISNESNNSALPAVPERGAKRPRLRSEGGNRSTTKTRKNQPKTFLKGTRRKYAKSKRW